MFLDILSPLPSSLLFLVDAFDVECDFSHGKEIRTIVHHDAEARIYVTGYHLPGSYERRVDYGMSRDQLAAIRSSSTHCDQFVKIECFSAAGMEADYWVNFAGERRPWTVEDGGQCGCILPSACSLGWKG